MRSGQDVVADVVTIADRKLARRARASSRWSLIQADAGPRTSYRASICSSAKVPSWWTRRTWNGPNDTAIHDLAQAATIAGCEAGAGHALGCRGYRPECLRRERDIEELDDKG